MSSGLASRRRRRPSLLATSLVVAVAVVAAAPMPTLAAPGGALGSAAPGDGSDPLGSVDWRNHRYEVECGAELAEIELVGGRWVDPELHDPAAGSFRSVIFDGAVVLPGHDVVLVNLGCLAGGVSAALSTTTLVYVHIDDDGGARQLAAVTVPVTRDITVGVDGDVSIGHHTYLGDEPMCCPEGYVTIAVTWDGELPVAQEPTAAEAPALPQPDPAGLDDPTAGLPATPPTVPVGPERLVPAEFACVHVELAPGYGDPFTNGLLQTALQRRGFETGTDYGDGEFGAATQAAVAAWVEADREALTSFTAGDPAAIDQALTSGVVRLPLLDALGIGCATGVLPLEALTEDGETSP